MSEDFTEFAKANQRIGRNQIKKELLTIFWHNPEKQTDAETLERIYKIIKVLE